MLKLKAFIEDNLEDFYKDEAFLKKFLSKPVSKRERDVKTILANKSEEMRKEKLLNNILEYCQTLVIKRRNRVYAKKIALIKEKTFHRIDYQLRNNYLEAEIEMMIKFFKVTLDNNANDMVDKLRDITKSLRKNEKKNEKRISLMKDQIRDALKVYVKDKL